MGLGLVQDLMMPYQFDDTCLYTYTDMYIYIYVNKSADIARRVGHLREDRG